MSWQDRGRQAYVQCYKSQNNLALQIIGLILIGIGLLLLFLCIPGWAWAALIGTLLIAAGYLLLRLNSGGK